MMRYLSCLALLLVLCPAALAVEGSVTAEQIIEELIKGSSTQTVVDDKGYTLPETSPHISVPVYFGYNSAALSEVAYAQLKEVARALTTMRENSRALLMVLDKDAKPAAAPEKVAANAAPAVGKDDRILIDGHTDDSGSKEHNLKLSQQRADAVRAYLIEQGVSGELLIARGLGSGRPVAPNTTEESRARNRRVDFVRVSRVDAPAATPAAAGGEQAVLNKIFFPKDVAQGAVKFLDVKFVLRPSGGAEILNQAIKTIKDGDNFRAEVRSLRGCFLNVILKNADGQIEWLHPQSTEPMEVWSYADSLLALPGPTVERWYTSAGAKGLETVFVIATETPVGSHEELTKLIREHGSGLTSEQIKKALKMDFAELHLVAFEHI